MFCYLYFPHILLKEFLHPRLAAITCVPTANYAWRGERDGEDVESGRLSEGLLFIITCGLGINTQHLLHTKHIFIVAPPTTARRLPPFKNRRPSRHTDEGGEEEEHGSQSRRRGGMFVLWYPCALLSQALRALSLFIHSCPCQPLLASHCTLHPNHTCNIPSKLSRSRLSVFSSSFVRIKTSCSSQPLIQSQPHTCPAHPLSR